MFWDLYNSEGKIVNLPLGHNLCEAYFTQPDLQ